MPMTGGGAFSTVLGAAAVGTAERAARFTDGVATAAGAALLRASNLSCAKFGSKTIYFLLSLIAITT